MSSLTAVDDHRVASRVDQPTTPSAALTALGIVYGDLGTSPLYTLNAVAQIFGGNLSPAVALGSLSLIVWLLIITISIKYCLFVMRADQHGEGGILALMSLTGASWHGRGQALIVMGLLGAALLYGDGIVTPAISVLSALEGLNVATEFFKPHVMPMAVAILVALFAVQSRGTARIAWAFGPVMLIWFITIALLGLGGIVRQPGVIAALNPAQAVAFLVDNPRTGFVVLGAAFLAVTGGEAPLCGYGDYWPQTDPYDLVLLGAAGVVAQLRGPGRPLSRRSGDRRKSVLPIGAELGDLPDGSAGTACYYHRQPSDYHRHLFDDPPSHAAGLVSRRAHPPDLR